MTTIKTTEKGMTLPELRMKAKALGLKAGRMKKTELIHAIQLAEGYSPCFGTTNGDCSQTDCCFLKDCLKGKA